MMKLSPNSLRLVDDAVRRSNDAQVRAAWASYDRDPAKELPAEAALVALRAVRIFEDRRCTRLLHSWSESEVSDLSVDLGFVFAIEDELARQVGA